jgi:pyruvate formate lyase activating enzyme
MKNPFLICDLCPRQCRIPVGSTGFCGARKHFSASQESGGGSGHIGVAAPGLISALALDPIEKKPLTDFMPGTGILSVGQFGCNLRCPFCQNYDIGPDFSPPNRSAGSGQVMTSQELVSAALECRSRGNVGIAFTYNEPLIAWEFVRETFLLAREAGLVTALVSNGCFSAPVMEAAAQLTDAWNIDLKCFTSQGYRSLGGDLEAVKQGISIAARRSHVEVTTLVVPGFNDSPQEIEALACWLASVERDPRRERFGPIPLHLTRFFPRYRMAQADPTPVPHLRKLQDIARRHLERVLVGNC